jgi:hypothetical protein
MSFPNISEYNKSILEHNGFSFRTLRGLNFVPSRSHPIKIYTFGSGSFAVTFRASDGNKDFAIRCFIVPNYEIINRYSSIVTYLNQVNESWKVDTEYYNDEILVNNSYFPIIKMDWVSGLQLNEFIGRHLSNNKLLTTVQSKLVELSQSLERSKVGHGDLQSSNLIVWESNEDITLKLIDYDGMYVPAFRGRTILKSIFLHPNFDKIEFNERIDRFSIWLLLTAIEALKYDKALWNSPLENGFNNGDNILFEPGMLADFPSSGLYKRLRNLNIRSLNLYLDKLTTYSNLSFDPNNVDKPEIFKSENIFEHPPTKPTSLISSPVIIIPPPISTPKSITINSNPEGLPVLIENNVHSQIGLTPLNYSYDQLKNKTIYIKHGKESKQFTFNNYPNDINIVFDVESEKKGILLVFIGSLIFVLMLSLLIYFDSKDRIRDDTESIKSSEIENVTEIQIEKKTYHLDNYNGWSSRYLGAFSQNDRLDAFLEIERLNKELILQSSNPLEKNAELNNQWAWQIDTLSKHFEQIQLIDGANKDPLQVITYFFNEINSSRQNAFKTLSRRKWKSFNDFENWFLNSTNNYRIRQPKLLNYDGNVAEVLIQLSYHSNEIERLVTQKVILQKDLVGGTYEWKIHKFINLTFPLPINTQLYPYESYLFVYQSDQNGSYIFPFLRINESGFANPEYLNSDNSDYLASKCFYQSNKLFCLKQGLYQKTILINNFFTYHPYPDFSPGAVIGSNVETMNISLLTNNPAIGFINIEERQPKFINEYPFNNNYSEYIGDAERIFYKYLGRADLNFDNKYEYYFYCQDYEGFHFEVYSNDNGEFVKLFQTKYFGL